jgi:hypothetical protein
MKKKVNNKVLSSRIIAAVLTGAVLSCYTTPVWANDGGEWKKISGVEHYVGIKNPSGSTLVIDEKSSSSVSCTYGGYAYDGTGSVKNNTVIVDGGIVTGKINGGYSSKSNTEANHVVIKSGEAKGRISGAENKDFDAVKNTVTVTGGAISKTNNHIVGAFVNGQGNVKENEVTISGGTVDVWTIAGGEIHNNSAGLGGSVQNNSVTISGTDVKAMRVFGGYGNDGNVTGNSVTISNGDISNAIYGGFSDGTGNVKVML